jgi:hypothetical protein
LPAAPSWVPLLAYWWATYCEIALDSANTRKS